MCGGQGDTTATFGIVDMMKKSGVTKEELSNSRLLTSTVGGTSKMPLTPFPLAVCDSRFVVTAELCRSSIGAGVSEYAGKANISGQSNSKTIDVVYFKVRPWQGPLNSL